MFYSTELDDVLSSEYSYSSQDYRNTALVAGEGEGNDRVMVVVENDVEEPPTPPTPTQYTITLSVDPAGGGTATGGGTYTEGQNVTVLATPSTDYTFTGWKENGAIVSAKAAYTFKATGNRMLTAIFAASITNYTIALLTDPANGGTVSGGGIYERGQQVTVSAAPANGYRFVAWMDGGQTPGPDLGIVGLGEIGTAHIGGKGA